MREFIEQRKTQAMVATGTLMTGALTTSPALAAAEYDLTAVSAGVKDQVQAALTVGLPIAGGLIALSVGIGWVRRLIKSR